MTGPRHDAAEPTTLALHDQWAADRLDPSETDLVDFVGAFLTVPERLDSSGALSEVTP
ncbi:hypothetical protein [Streptomyces gardneri]|uniref:hypothetical protein n=1 Tax=Streptomyces gardneri TaxID=66892 RepID=UPI0035E216BB